jgi:hypothetical protein
MLLAFSVLYGRTGMALNATDTGSWQRVSPLETLLLEWMAVLLESDLS